MKRSLTIIYSVVSLNVFAACYKDNPVIADHMTTQPHNDTDTLSKRMKIIIGSSTFTATLSDNETATAFKTMLPLTLKMSELNGNEKYFRFSNNLPSKASNPGTIYTGDLMLWGANTLVLFYQTFSTTYSYTRIGRIDDLSGLAEAVGSDSVMVTFEME